MESPGHAVNFYHPLKVDGIFQRLLARLFPAHCLLCKAPARGELDLCDDCHADLPWLGLHCRLCAEPLSQQGVCGKCLSHPPALSRTICPLRYQAPVDRLIQGYKFQRQLNAGRTLGLILAMRLASDPQALPQALIPVPMHIRRLRQRGYNQAQWVARDLGRWLNLPVLSHSLLRQRHTQAQSGLSLKQRQRNLRRAFTVSRPVPQHVALIDDVVTSTSTVRACATTLRQAGAESIEVWALARTA